MKNTQIQNKPRTKREKAELRRGKAEKKKKLKIIWSILGGVVILGGILVSAVLYNPDLPGEKVEIMDEQNHIPSVAAPHTPYNSDPPTSGPHVEQLANWGMYKEPVPKEVLVHNLEDGGIVIYYNKSADDETIKKLENIISLYQSRIVVTPYPEMGNKITLTAWGRIDRLAQWDENRVTAFIDRYMGIDHH